MSIESDSIKRVADLDRESLISECVQRTMDHLKQIKDR